MRLTLAARSLVSFCLGTLATPSVYPASCCHAVYLTPLLTGPAPPAHPPAFRVHSLFSYLTPLVSRVSLCLTAKNIKILLSRYYEATYVGRSFRATVFHPTARGRDGESSDEKRPAKSKRGTWGISYITMVIHSGNISDLRSMFLKDPINLIQRICRKEAKNENFFLESIHILR